MGLPRVPLAGLLTSSAARAGLAPRGGTGGTGRAAASARSLRERRWGCSCAFVFMKPHGIRGLFQGKKTLPCRIFAKYPVQQKATRVT